MTLSQEQLDWIVNEVVRRVLATLNTDGTKPATASTLALDERLITLETLRDRLQGVSTLEVKPKAIVTPAVVDLLKERNVTLRRVSP